MGELQRQNFLFMANCSGSVPPACLCCCNRTRLWSAIKKSPNYLDSSAKVAKEDIQFAPAAAAAPKGANSFHGENTHTHTHSYADNFLWCVCVGVICSNGSVILEEQYRRDSYIMMRRGPNGMSKALADCKLERNAIRRDVLIAVLTD